ncbi:hypothetical protein RFI_08586, partial [Reticulomyxa filosa]
MSQRVRLVKERFLSISKNVLLSWLIENLKTEEEKSQFRELCSSIEALFHAQRVAQIEVWTKCICIKKICNFEIKQCYSTFDRFNRQAADEIAQTNQKELQLRQDRLLENIVNILNDSNFTPVTFEDYTWDERAVKLSNKKKKKKKKECINIMDWAKLDSYLLTDFFEKHRRLNPYRDVPIPPPFHNHFILYHCGTGMITKSNVYMDHKINLICADIQSYFKQLLQRVFLLLQAALFTADNNPPDVNNSPIVNEHNSNNVNEENDDDYVQRVSLVDTYTTAKSQGMAGVLWWFLSRVTLQVSFLFVCFFFSLKIKQKEPTFRHVVLVYRSLTEGLLEEKLRRAKEDSLKLSRKVRSTVKRRLQQIKESYSTDKQNEEGGNDNDLQEEEEENQVQERVSSANSNTEQGNAQQQAKTGKPLYNEFKRQQSATKFQDPITSSIASQDE